MTLKSATPFRIFLFVGLLLLCQPVVGQDDLQDQESAEAQLQAALDQISQNLEDFNDRLKNSKTWAKKVKNYQNTGKTILDIEYFKTNLEKVDYFTQRNLLAVAALFDAMNRTANKHPRTASAEQISITWQLEKKKFVEYLTSPEGNKESADAGLAWLDFLNQWEQDAVSVDPTRFDDALKQAAIIITGQLNEMDNQSIEEVLTGTVGSSASGNYYSSNSYIGHGIRAVWHEKHKAHIQRRIDRIRSHYGR